MKITILAIGKIKENYFTAAIAEYVKRLSPWAKINFIEIPEAKTPDNPSPADRQKAIDDEGERLLKRLDKNSAAFLLDLHGEEMTSESFAEMLEKATLKHSSFTFIIGGPFGVSDALRRAALPISFSKLTFTHQMIRLLLVEQIYRAFKINHGEKYHW